MLDRPESRWAAGALGVLAALSVGLTLLMASCQGGGIGTASASSRLPLPGASERGGSTSTTASGPTSTGRGAGTTSGTQASAPVLDANEPIVRVRILSGVESVALASAGGLMIAAGDPNPLLALPIERAIEGAVARAPGVTVASDAAPGSGLQARLIGNATRVGLAPGAWVLTDGAGEETRVPAAYPLLVWGGSDTLIGVNGAQYSGRLRLIVRSDLGPRAFDVIEHTSIEQYLPGVVQKELLAGWPLEAYRVQAVCARTYALHERQRSITSGEKFDLESSDRDQVYSGASVSPPVADAVRSTRGQVLKWNDQILRAYFSSTCGGRTASARDTWPIGPGYEYNLAAPLQAKTREHACQVSPLYRWSAVRERSEMVKRLKAFGEKNGLPFKRLKDLGAIEPAQINDDQRASRFRLVEPGLSGASYTISAEELRLAANTDAPGLPAIERKTRVNSSDIDVRVAGNLVTFSGRGFGHGVGMCQYCAKGFAERGEDWRTIVQRFYPGAKIVSAY